MQRRGAVKPKDASRAANAPEEVQADSRNTAQGFKNNQNNGLSQRNPHSLWINTGSDPNSTKPTLTLIPKVVAATVSNALFCPWTQDNT